MYRKWGKRESKERQKVRKDRKRRNTESEERQKVRIERKGIKTESKERQQAKSWLQLYNEIQTLTQQGNYFQDR